MRSILVTGANKGIGLALAREVLRRHADTFVWLGSRSSRRGSEAVAGLIAEDRAWADRLEVLELDVTSDESVARARAQVAGRGARLHGVVNNAGIGATGATLAAVLDVNTLGIHRVCAAFAPLIDPTSGRIVNITSASGPSFVSRCMFLLFGQLEESGRFYGSDAKRSPLDRYRSTGSEPYTGD